MTINSKQKGCRGERELSSWLTERDFPARRTAQYCGKTGDASDVVCERLSGFHLECKRMERLRIYEALNQAIRDCAGKTISMDRKVKPVVFHKRNADKWVVIMDGEDFLDLCVEAGY